ncbi:hypothetical protein MNBD_GAMMA09-517 [hydrothermal vent metagenome]|uniref:Pvc16 N-terminal domain-containing protein n=1 Tax=hydrothermal vent metagenome TaxID=652676 RepID=A0A3B0XIX0_9ZZZZ
MANIYSINSVGDSIIQYLRNAYPQELREAYPCDFRVVSSGELVDDSEDFGTALTLYLYRVIINEHVRNVPSNHMPGDSKISLAVDLHLMLSIWADSSAAEHTICAWAMRELHQNPILDVSSLTEVGGWSAHDVVNIIPAELSNEDLMRIWDAIAPYYRLSLSYIARVVRIDADESAAGLPVVATRYNYKEKEEPDD